MQDSCRQTWAVLTADGIITRQPSFLCCLIVTVANSGNYVELYEGRDATSGRKILTLQALQNRSVAFNFTRPIMCERGIFVHFSHTGSEATVVYGPVEYAELRQKQIE